MAFSTRDISNYYGYAVPTVRNWAIEFEQYLSPTANPGDGKQRSFSIEDLKVISIIAEYKRNGATYEEIHAALRVGVRGPVPDITEQELKALSATEGEKRASLEVQALQRAILDLREQLNRAELKAQQVDELVKDNTRLSVLNEEVVKQRDDLQKRLDDAQRQIAELNRQMGKEFAQGFREGFRERSREDEPEE